nr:TPA_asm: hypothetical protein 3 [Taeniapi tapwovirus]
MIKNVLRESGVSIFSNSIVQSLGGIASTATGGLGVSALYKKVKDKVVAKKEKGCKTIKFKHITTGPDGVFCSCGIEHAHQGHLVLLTVPGDELGQINVNHYHKQAGIVCLCDNCVSYNDNDESIPLVSTTAAH